MLSLYTLKSAKDASTYYQRGDYYTEGGAESYSQWFGQGAETFGLTGAVNFEVFEKLLEGRLPDGTLMTQVEKGLYHRPGYDLTFSPPKSVSILALVADSQVVLEAHREAVKKTLQYLESQYAGCRNKDQGVITFERTANLTVATFEHSDSRAGDPALHTHAVVMNVTQKSTGEWRTLFTDEFYQEVLLHGKVYESHLAQGLMQRGFELVLKEKGHFEIKDVPEALIHFYSKRRAQIKAWLTEHDLSGSKAAELANFMTRQAKVDANPLERQARWGQELGGLGSSVATLNSILKTAEENGPIEPPDPKLMADKALQAAMNHLSEWHPAFSVKQLVKSAKLLSLLPVNEGDLLIAIEQKIADKNLLYLDNQLLTTHEAKTLEQNTILTMQQGQQSVDKILPSWIAQFISRYQTIDKKAQKALTSLLTSNDRQVLISSNSKALLNQVLKDFIEISSNQRCYPRMLIQNKVKIESLKNKFNTERVQTIEGFLLACEERILKRREPQHLLERWDRRFKHQAARDIWIVTDDISIKQLERLGYYSDALGARIILTQSKLNEPSLHRLKVYGIEEVKLRASQADMSCLKIQTALLAALEKFKPQQVQEALDQDKRFALAVARYLDVAPQESLLVTLNHFERITLNHLVRKGLKYKGILKDVGENFQILRSLNLSLAEKSELHLYQPGDVIRFNRDLPETPIQKGHYFEVQQVNLEKGFIELQQENIQIFWNPQKHLSFLKQVEVFKKEARELQEGDIICWTRFLKHATDKTLDRIKGERACVTAVYKNRASIQLQNGREFILKSEELKQQHWDYGYALSLRETALSVKEIVVVLNHQPLHAKNIALLNDLLTTAPDAKVQTAIICPSLTALKKTLTTGVHEVTLKHSVEAPYKRAEALHNEQTLATQPLFNRLQSEYLKVNQLNPEFLPNPSLPVTPVPSSSSELRIACEVVEKTVLYHAEQEAVLNLEKLTKDAIKLGALVASVSAIEQAVDLAVQQGWLIRVGENEQGESLVTAKHTLLIEELCIQKMKEGQNQLTPILAKDSPQLQEIEQHPHLTPGQKEAIQLILTTPDRMVAVQGIAGAGKTTALKEINRLCAGQNVALVLANTGSAKNQAEQVSKLTAKTTAQFLTEMERTLSKEPLKIQEQFGKNPLFILDESSLVSSRDFFRLQNIIERLRARLALVGDFNQQGSMGAGLVHHDLLAYSINRAVMNENVRLNEMTSLLAMKQAYQGDIGGALTTLKDSIEEIPVKEEALNRLVVVYFALTPLLSQPPLIITPLNKDRLFVNEAIREKMKEKGILIQQGLTVPVFVSANKREINKSDAFSYESQDIIRFNTPHPRLGVKAGDYATILNIDLEHQRLTLKIEGKQEFYWSPKDLVKPSAIEIYRQELREFSPNDTVVFKRNNEALGIFNGDKATILTIEKAELNILLTSGNTLTLDLSQKQNQHLDHGYALTTYAAQSRDVQFVIAYGEGPKPRLRKTERLRVGDIVVLPKDLQFQALPGELSKVVKVTSINSDRLRFQDREGHIFDVKPDKNGVWSYFPPIKQRKAREFPLSTSQESFIIQITRGDGLFLVVPNLGDFQENLERHQQLKKSALSYQDKNWQTLSQGVKRLGQNIRGKPALEQLIKEKESQKNSTAKTSEPTSPAKPKHFQDWGKKEAYIDKEVINQRLQKDILGYASQWLGSPKKISGYEARWTGALTVNIRGPKAGLWKRWSTGEGGKDLISLYAAAYGLSWKEALQELSKNLGVNETSSKLPAVKLKEPQQAEAAIKEQINRAKALYDKGTPIAGTLAEKYLRDYRHITGELPKDFRFIKAAWHFETKESLPALLAPIRNKDDHITGIVRIFLNPDGSKYQKTYLDEEGKKEKAVSKANLGISGSGAVVVQRGTLSTTLWIAEGIETALSIAKAKPNQTVLASLSVNQIKQVPLNEEVQRVVICADNDPASSKTKENIVKAVDTFLSQGLKVFIALPPEIPTGMNKYDFNDLHKKDGIPAVQKSLERMLEIKDTNVLKTVEPRLATDLKNIRLKNDSVHNQNQHLAPENNRDHVMEKTEISTYNKSLNKDLER